MVKKFLKLLIVLVFVMGLSACGFNKKNNDAAASDKSNAQKPVEAESKKEASQSKEGKEKSGKVVVYMPSPSGLNKKYVENFESETGIKVELFEGTTGEILARLETEKENPVADVIVLASWSDGLAVKNKGILESYKEAVNADKLYPGWVDKDSMLFGTSASSVGVIYNTTLINKLEADWKDLASEKYKNMLAIADPQKSGSCKDFLAAYMYDTNEDWTAFKGMAENGMIIPGANKAAIEAVTTGERAILVAGVDYNAYSSMKKGEPIDIYYPKSGTIINPRPAMILKTSANMENAKLFINYLMSDGAQKLVADAFLLPGRQDISCSNRKNVSEIPQLKVDWEWMMSRASEFAAKLDELCK